MSTPWHDRWREGRIGFHRAEVHPTLVDIAQEHPFFPGTVFVPLAGKTIDLAWLARRGARVVAVELVELAVEAFFAEQGLDFEVTRDGALRRFGAREVPLTFYLGDVFDLEPRHLEGVTWTHDRAAIVALPPADRERYAAHLTQILPAEARMLLTTFEYDPTEMDGPPFSVPQSELERLFPDFTLTLERTRELGDGISHLKERGLGGMQEHVFFACRARAHRDRGNATRLQGETT